MTWPACDAEESRQLGIEYFLHLLELDEVVAGPDVREPDPGELLDGPGKLAPDPLGSPVGVGVQSAPFLHPVELRWIDPEPVDREVCSLGGAANDLVRGQVAPVGRGIRQAFANPAVEVGDG